jgi:hypothetical protein
MTWWLIGILGYLIALGFVLILAGGVRRNDRVHDGARRDPDSASRETDPREALLRPAALPPRPSAHVHAARRAARS